MHHVAHTGSRELFRLAVYAVALGVAFSASLAQIGEFSFILIGLGISLDLVSSEAQNLVLAGAIVSIVLNPVMFGLAERLRREIAERMLDRIRDDGP